MSIRHEAYRGKVIEVDSFQLLGTNHFITSLTIFEMADPKSILVQMPVTHRLFDCEEQAFQETLAHGRLLVDGLTMQARLTAPMFKEVSLLKRRSTD